MNHSVYQHIHNHRDQSFTMKKCFNPGMFTWDDVNMVFNNPVHLREFTLAGLDHEKIPVNKYFFTWEALVDRDQLFYGLKNGFTLAVNNIHSYNFAIQEVVSTLEKIFNGSADTHLYVSLTDYSKSFGIHHDVPYNLILQTEGTCEWNVWDTDDIAQAKKIAPAIHTILEPGDLIYIPSKIVHQCIPQGKRVSLSIPIKPDTPSIFRRKYDLFNISREEL